MDNNPRDAATYSTAGREEPLLLRGMPQPEGVRDEENVNMEPGDQTTTQEPGNPQQEQEKANEAAYYQIRVITPRTSFRRKAARALEGVKNVFRKIHRRFKRKKPTEEPQGGTSTKKYSTRGQLLPPYGREDIRK